MNACASTLLREIAGPRGDGGVKAQIARAARRANLTYSRAFELWYGRARRIEAHEMDRLRAVASGRADTGELRAIADDMEKLASRIARVDPGMAGPQADAWRALAGVIRGLAHGG
jgi:hypothetical protein